MQQSDIPVIQNKILSITTTEIPGNKHISVTTSTAQQLPMQTQPTQVAVYIIVAFLHNWFRSECPFHSFDAPLENNSMSSNVMVVTLLPWFEQIAWNYFQAFFGHRIQSNKEWNKSLAWIELGMPVPERRLFLRTRICCSCRRCDQNHFAYRTGFDQSNSWFIGISREMPLKPTHLHKPTIDVVYLFYVYCLT